MASVPWSSNSISFLPKLFALWHRSHIADDLVAWSDGKRIAKAAKFDNIVTVADTAGEYLYKYLGSSAGYDIESDDGTLTSPSLGS